MFNNVFRSSLQNWAQYNLHSRTMIGTWLSGPTVNCTYNTKIKCIITYHWPYRNTSWLFNCIVIIIVYISVIIKALTEIETKSPRRFVYKYKSYRPRNGDSLVLISCLKNITQPFCLIKGSESINNWLRSSSIKPSTAWSISSSQPRTLWKQN